ncbi:DUF1499 domain-containing protein [Gymnodinialimonas hymeniacidonis]|uniref:DUF1499 domain-containing protein n=1 Tax=Gymnodinialimonas hymeniacidonis TaxID=3126508 RepID=UPI0034C683E9
MRILLYILIAIVVLAVAAAVYFRFAPLDAEALHVDPAEVTPPTNPNFALMVGTSGHFIQATPEEIATRIAAVAEADGATLLSGSPEDGHVTYVVRSRMMGFPDIMSLRWQSQDNGTQLEIFARSVYGYSDMGVNTRRAHRWSQAARGATVFSDGD